MPGATVCGVIGIESPFELYGRIFVAKVNAQGFAVQCPGICEVAAHGIHVVRSKGISVLVIGYILDTFNFSPTLNKINMLN
jgi:hypothetical protein